MIQTGIRVSELTGLRIGDVHLGIGAHIRVTGKGRKKHLGLLLIGAEPAGAQPGSRWSPARVRTAGADRTDLDPSEHRPTLAGAGADRLTDHLTTKIRMGLRAAPGR